MSAHRSKTLPNVSRTPAHNKHMFVAPHGDPLHLVKQSLHDSNGPAVSAVASACGVGWRVHEGQSSAESIEVQTTGLRCVVAACMAECVCCAVARACEHFDILNMRAVCTR